MLRRAGCALLCLAVLAPLPLHAQSRPIVLGTDLSLSWYPDGGHFVLAVPSAGLGSTSTLPAPVTGVRLGIPISDWMSIEPATSLSVLSDLDDTFVAWNLAARLLYHFHDDLSRSRPYIAGLGALTLLDGGEAATQFGIGAEAGVSVPIAERVGWRFGGGYYHGFESDDFETRDIFYGLLGISIFLGGDADG